MIARRTAPCAAFAPRLTPGAPFLAHAGLKLFVFTPAGTAGFFRGLGLSGALAHPVIAAGLAGGAAPVAGVYARAAALALRPGADAQRGARRRPGRGRVAATPGQPAPPGPDPSGPRLSR